MAGFGFSCVAFHNKILRKLPQRRLSLKRCIQYIFRTYAESFSPIFSKKFIEIVIEKSCAKIENRTNFVDKLCVEITFSGKFAVKIKAETKNCVKICFA